MAKHNRRAERRHARRDAERGRRKTRKTVRMDEQRARSAQAHEVIEFVRPRVTLTRTVTGRE